MTLLNGKITTIDINANLETTNIEAGQSYGVSKEYVDNKTDMLIITGDGTQYLSDDGTYKIVESGNQLTNTDDLDEGNDNLYFTENRVSENINVSGNTTNRHSHSNKNIIDNIINTGDGTKYLSDDGDYKIVESGSQSPLTTIGDLYTYDTSGNTRMPVGAVGQVLVADPSSETGMKWETPEEGYGYFTIWAEESAGVNAGGYEWSFGNGDETQQGRGIPIGVNCELYAIGVEGDGRYSVSVHINGVGIALSNISATNSEITELETPYQIYKGNVLNFRTGTVTVGGSTGNRVAAYLRYKIKGIIGSGTGDTGDLTNYYTKYETDTTFITIDNGVAKGLTMPPRKKLDLGGYDRITPSPSYYSGNIEIGGSTSSALLAVQEGNGRILLKWNATQGTNEKFLVDDEPAGIWDFNPVFPDDKLFKVRYAPGDDAVAGEVIVTEDIFSVGLETFNYYDKVVYDNVNEKLNIKGEVTIGDVSNGNYFHVDGNGEVRLFGEAKQWDDLRFPFIDRNIDTSSGRIDYDYTELGIGFQPNARMAETEQISLIVQFPHQWATGSVIKPHLHWFQNQDAQPNFMIKYRWYNNGDTIPTTWTSVIMSDDVFNYTGGTILQISEFPITVPANIDAVSSFLDIKFYRDTNNDSDLFSGNDSYTGRVLAKEFDIHYQIDGYGSENELIKD